MNRFFCVAAALAIAGCASQPDDIQTAYVSETQYQDYDCEQLQIEAKNVTRRAADLRGRLQKDADNDAAQMGVGLVLFWPALFLLEGGDGVEAQQYARLKGERDAIERAAVPKKCELKFYDASQIAEAGPTFNPNADSKSAAGLTKPNQGEAIDGRILHALINESTVTGQLRLCMARISNPENMTSKLSIYFQSDGLADITIECAEGQQSRNVSEKFVANWSVTGNKLCFRKVPENESSFGSKCAEVFLNKYEYVHETNDGGALGFTIARRDLPFSTDAQVSAGYELVVSKN